MNQTEVATVIRDWLRNKGIRVSDTLINPKNGSPTLFPYFSLNGDDGYISIVKSYICFVFPPYWLQEYFMWTEQKYSHLLHQSSLKTVDSDDATHALLREISIEIEQLIPGWHERSIDADSSKITVVLEQS